MIIRPANREDHESFYGKPPPVTMKALVADYDGEVKGIGGYYLYQWGAVAFSDNTEMPKRDMIRGARAIMKLLESTKIKMVATTTKHGSTVVRHFGFRQLQDDLYVME